MNKQFEPIMDFEARQNALDITKSYAVQAPAGSGKTELLSLRFLRLLAVCEQPEEVLAITFTRKAANEMAERILTTLAWADKVDARQIENQLDRDRYSAAKSVLAQDRKNEWSLQQLPNRLRIQTIDSFCHLLASRLPVLSNFGGSLQVSENVNDCYHLAIQNCLKLLDQESAVSGPIAELMLHFDNDSNKIENLLLELLKQREQWIEDIVGVVQSPEQAVSYLTENVLELIEESLQAAATHLQAWQARLMPLLHYATENLTRDGATSMLSACAGLDELPDTAPAKLECWVGLTALLLTTNKDKPAFRKTVNKNTGFPAASGSQESRQLCSEKKQDMVELLESLSESRELLQALDYLRRLPEPDEEAQTWEFLASLTKILPVLVAQLELAFAGRGKVDYPQVSLAALRALGTDEAPTDLALSLDYQIKHVLVDEFQDTSSAQMSLLHKLTTGWEPDDGRTLFVVGDAMQSCYSFRNANVGLFIKLRESGLGSIRLEPIDLLANFRSDAGIVNWVNRLFARAFPERNDISRGAVSYSRSAAVHPADIASAVSTRCYHYGEGSKTEACLEEAAYITDEISRLRAHHAEASIAILVRSRSHLEFILPALREAEIPWLANEIDKLDSQRIITDMTSLTSALCNQADRLSWLALLRAPWCGLKLEDLHSVANWNPKFSILESLRQLTAEPAQHNLSPDGLVRLKKVTPLLINAIMDKARYRLSRVMQSLFADLDGAQTLQSAAELDNLEKFYELVRESEVAGDIENFADFRRKIANSFISTPANSQHNNPIHVMTIHKSKGLEFDHVFLPGLARASRADDKSLLLWQQRLNQTGNNKLFLATLSATGSEDSSLYKLLRFEKAAKARFETTRLLYIGITRAMKSVYLSAALPDKGGEPDKPDSRSLLHTIWDSLLAEDDADSTFACIPVNATAVGLLYQENLLLTAPTLSRLPDKFFKPDQATDEARNSAIEEPGENSRDAPPEFVQDNQLPVQIGKLIHEALQNYLDNSTLLQAENLPGLQQRWQRQLQSFDFSSEEIQAALGLIERSLVATLGNDKINWIFDSTLEASAAELAIQTCSNGFLRTHVIDRTFIDKQGQRWIIDYKSSGKPENLSIANFLDEQMQRHAAQLSRYKSLFRKESNRGIRTALLFTSLPQLVEYNN